ncbi:hypothetical protein C2845_PM03G05370 [Panicum miliaceum]|uniref:O-fucosyltransferase family protein n=1 Tax=Panicum miliaceum TaxID=4540 RepID=A0A3L6T8Y8_PANMI|nr:hypothetical protein C2845_PM03G05370 [Panicum miliaceum]
MSVLLDLITNGSGGELEGTESGEAFSVPTHGWIGQDDPWHSKLASNFYRCCNSSSKYLDSSITTQPERYLIVVTSGGLNQQRTGIVDAVVAARILNATLVVPKLDQTSFWKDSSNFSEIFDIGWFISFLAKDVKIIKEPPVKGGKAMKPYKMCVPRKCTPRCYLNRVLPALLKKHDYRLSNKLDTDLQKLRCRVNYHALKFTDPIQELGEKLIKRMREKSRYFTALHLRFEPDMLAFSGCYYGGGEKERRELAAIRRRWRTLHIRDPEKGRRQGEEELAPFLKFSSRMAAIDFIVCDESDAFVANNIGNMAKILAGRRRYFGHKRTIRPNAKQLYPLFMKRGNMSWDAFSAQMRIIQKGYMGDPMEITPGRGEFHANPASCICEKTGGNSVAKSISRSNQEPVNDTGIRKAVVGPPYPVYTDEEADGSDTEDDQDTTARGEMIDAEPDDDSVVDCGYEDGLPSGNVTPNGYSIHEAAEPGTGAPVSGACQEQTKLEVSQRYGSPAGEPHSAAAAAVQEQQDEQLGFTSLARPLTHIMWTGRERTNQRRRRVQAPGSSVPVSFQLSSRRPPPPPPVSSAPRDGTKGAAPAAGPGPLAA